MVVFRYPEEPEVSYIKRLVGLPERDDPDPPRRHLRRAAGRGRPRSNGCAEPLEHQRAMQMMVYDDAHRAGALRGRPRVAALEPPAPATGEADRRARIGPSRDRSRLGRAALPPPRARPRAVGGRPATARPARPPGRP